MLCGKSTRSAAAAAKWSSQKLAVLQYSVAAAIKYALKLICSCT